MSVVAQDLASSPQAAQVLSKAVVRAASRMGVSRSRLAGVLGVSAATVTRLCRGSYVLDPQRKEWEFALLFVRVFRSLDSLVGNEETARRWLQGDNRGLQARPIDLLAHTEGLVRVVHYLDASRGLV